MRKHAYLRSFWSSVTPSVLMVSENGMEMPAIVDDATGGKVRIRWRVPIKIDSDLLLFRASIDIGQVSGFQRGGSL